MLMFIRRLHYSGLRTISGRSELHREGTAERKTIDPAQIALQRSDQTVVSTVGIGAAIHQAADIGKGGAAVA
jgi:hypothetical protein